MELGFRFHQHSRNASLKLEKPQESKMKIVWSIHHSSRQLKAELRLDHSPLNSQVALLKLQESGNISIREAIGANGTTTVMIPPKGEGTGRVRVSVRNRGREFNAIHGGNDVIASSTSVRVTDSTFSVPRSPTIAWRRERISSRTSGLNVRIVPRSSAASGITLNASPA